MCFARKFLIMGSDFGIGVNQFFERVCPPGKTGRLTTLRESSEAENREPQLQNKRGNIL
jgi:hypothetical protein